MQTSYPAIDIVTKGLLLSAEAKRMSRSAPAPLDYLFALRDRCLYADAIQVLPQLLDKPRAVWWSCLCCWDALQHQPDSELETVLDGALGWLFDPSESNRLRLVVAEPHTDTPSAALRMAVVWSGGSMTAPHLPPVPPPPQLTARLAAVAVLLAAIQHPADALQDAHRHFALLGFEVLEGRLLWDEEILDDRVLTERVA